MYFFPEPQWQGSLRPIFCVAGLAAVVASRFVWSRAVVAPAIVAVRDRGLAMAAAAASASRCSCSSRSAWAAVRTLTRRIIAATPEAMRPSISP